MTLDLRALERDAAEKLGIRPPEAPTRPAVPGRDHQEPRMNNEQYHALGRAEDPKKAVLSASQLIAGFNPHRRSGAHPLETLRRITGEPDPPTFYTLAGTFLHLLLLEGAEPERIPPEVAKELGLPVELQDEWTWTATGLGAKGNATRLISLAGMRRLGPYLVPPSSPPVGGSLAGDEALKQFARVADHMELRIAVADNPPSLVKGRSAFDEAVETAAWLARAGSTSARHARYLLCGAPGEVEKTYRGQWNEIEIRGRPDKVLKDDPLVNLKRTYKAHPAAFWYEADAQGWWIAEAFYEAAMDTWDGGAPPQGGRPWIIVAISPATKTAPPQAYVYPCPEDRQARARHQLAEMMAQYEVCVETGRWETFAETLAEQPPPGSLFEYQADYEAIEEEMADEEEPPWNG